MTHAVLTGDIVASSKLEVTLRHELIAWLKTVSSTFAETHPGSVIGSIDVFRGDSWQLCLSQPHLAITAAVFLRAGLKAHVSREAVDTRIGIGLGTVDHLATDHLSESSGQAFERSGKALDRLKKTRLSLCSESDAPHLTLLENVALPLIDLEVTQWSPIESVAIFGNLQGWTQQQTAASELARKSDGKPPTQQAINNTFLRTHWLSHLQPVLDDIETHLNNNLFGL